jgi:hypothetical protein
MEEKKEKHGTDYTHTRDIDSDDDSKKERTKTIESEEREADSNVNKSSMNNDKKFGTEDESNREKLDDYISDMDNVEEHSEIDDELEGKNLFHKRTKITVPKVDFTQSRKNDSDDDSEEEMTKAKES